ncbi:hypothetical protein [Dongia deserti]|uniref:hypothetical protein n=1 Tax=Dongia deserti TaxID=2268030 RepID=UPI0013C533E3|nr:hypothetical protein [Dongia deserti]
MRNISLLAFLLVLVVLGGALLSLIAILGSLERLGIALVLGELFGLAILLIATAVGYALLLRFLALCDDIAVIRKAQTGTPSSFD